MLQVSAGGGDRICIGGVIDQGNAARLYDLLVASSARGDVCTLDMARVSFIDSAGISTLVRLTRSGRTVRITRPSPQVQRLLELSGLGDTLPAAPS